ncbi:MAG: hypothetical protein JXR95_07020 [Deltaproteobacteria bacterium]|nr:hypothetical protein [Deltaproteobacteria bacterium]
MDDFDLFDFFREPNLVNDFTSLKQTSMNEAMEMTNSKLQERYNMLLIATQAMWELFSEKLELSEKDLAKRIIEIDLRDGKLDGVYKKAPVQCPNCDAKISREFKRCLFCGYMPKEQGVFDKMPL